MTDYPTAPEMAQALVDADRNLQIAALRYEEALDHGSDADVDRQLRDKELARDTYDAARKPLQAALILTRSMTDETALYVALAVVKGETWPFHGDQRRIHLEARRTTLAEVSGWDGSQPFVPALTVTETVVLLVRGATRHGIVTLSPDGAHTFTYEGETHPLTVLS